LCTENSKKNNIQLMEQFKDHGIKFKATKYFAMMSFANTDIMTPFNPKRKLCDQS
tara:strand:+ start:143 stop:307 length:165 start_codon:yes stop_codon:yes gene_type:complete